MAQTAEGELVDRFEQFYRNYYRDEIAALAQRYPNEQRSLSIDWQDLYRFDADIADDFLAQPEQLREYAEEALRLYDLPVDVSLGQAHVRIQNLPEVTEIRAIRSHDVNSLVSVRGIIRKATEVRPKIEEAAFECQRCGTLTYIPQSGRFQEPHECQGCERQGPFSINYDQSQFVDAQKLRVQESPEGLRGGETPQSLDVHVEDDLAGLVTPGDHVTMTGMLRIEQQEQGNQKSRMFDVFMDGHSLVVDDTEFESMDITDDDKQAIIELSKAPDIYEQMVDSIAPSIYGYEQVKLAMVLQLFSGVTKHLPDESRIRGDLHLLLVGDPGTGKCQSADTLVTLADGTEVQIGDLVENHLDNPTKIDDGVYQNVDIPVLTLTQHGTLSEGTATKVWKREVPNQMYQIRTASGSELEVTPSHPLFVQSNGRLEHQVAEELKEDQFIAIPNYLHTNSDDALDILYQKSKSHLSRPLCLPETFSPNLASLLGYIIAEGHVSGKYQVTITNSEPQVINQTIDGIEKLGLTYRRATHNTNENSEIVQINSVEFVNFLKEIEPAILKRSADQRVPEAIMRSSKPIKMEFLKAYFEGEGYVSTKQREITGTSMSEELIKNVRSLLLSFGIQTSIDSRLNGSYRLRISGENFRRYVDQIGFVTDRKTEASLAFEDVVPNTNTDVIPNVGETLQRIREHLALSQFDCGIKRTTYQHYERDDRNPSRKRLSVVLDTFEDRLDWLQTVRKQLQSGDWGDIESLRNELNISQKILADGLDVTQTAISYYERHGVVPDGGRVADAQSVLLDRIDEALDVAEDVQTLRQLVESDVGWDRIESIEEVEPDYNWVYDLEVEGTHSYLANNIISHNSQLLQYIRRIAPRSVYTSGKGSSSAGLCVTGETEIHTTSGRQQIRDIAEPRLPEPVDENTAIEHSVAVYSFETEHGSVGEHESSLVWRMPEKPCRRIETESGTVLDASVNTPVLTKNGEGSEWVQISAIGAGDRVAISEGSGHPDADGISWDEVVAAVDTGEQEVFDLTVPETHNFLANGIVTHNTAAAVRDDFSEGGEWTLEAGALVLADKGIAAVDELDKMRCVTGETRVETADGLRSIEELATRAATTGSIEELSNGRTIRDIDLTVHTMTDDERLVTRPVTAIHEYTAPTTLVEVVLGSGQSVTATPDHPFFVREDGDRTERPASELEVGDRTYVPATSEFTATDGGTAVVDAATDSTVPSVGQVTTGRVTAVREVPGDGKSVYDLTVEGTHNFVANGMVVHNSEDRSAMHEALEQQSISISKAGINATLKSRCSLLGAANPKYGRFDQYEPIGEQIELDPALISRFDLIFTVTDQPDAEQDSNLADHILKTNYAGELNTQRTELRTGTASVEEIEALAGDVSPAIEPELVRKYIAYAKRNCFPTMTQEARDAIKEFYVDLRSRGEAEDSPVPVTARKLEALVRLAEASARVRLADTVEIEDAERVIEIVRTQLRDIGMDPETGQFDADVIETGTSKSQRDRIKSIRAIIADLESDYEEGAPLEVVIERAEEAGMERSKAEHEIEQLKQRGEVFEPSMNHLRTT